MLTKTLQAIRGEAEIKSFPDGETYVRILTDVKDTDVAIVCSLHHPDSKLLPVYFLSKTAMDLGAKSVTLIAPYLAYMRQDQRFKPGEGITSHYFASLVSGFVNHIITIDPHLHRISSLSNIYTVSSTVLHANDALVNWIRDNVENPLLIGPDSESEQWINQLKKATGAPGIVLKKTRHSASEVRVSLPQVDVYMNYTPVLIDDIISTADTMIETVQQLLSLGMKKPVCIGIHAVFSGGAYDNLKGAGAKEIVTCNTIPHMSNKIDIGHILAEGFRSTMNA